MTRRTILAAAFALGVAACTGSVPATRYYQLAMPTARAATDPAGSVIAVEPLTSDGAYDDERIVYRTDPVRLDYYQYHRWSSTPGTMVGSYLQRALADSGKFRSVVRDATTDTAAVLAGRVVAIEEVDDTAARTTAHIAVELTLTAQRTGEILWSQTFDQREPMASRTPEGLARALGAAMDRIVGDAAPRIAALAGQQPPSHRVDLEGALPSPLSRQSREIHPSARRVMQPHVPAPCSSEGLCH